MNRGSRRLTLALAVALAWVLVPASASAMVDATTGSQAPTAAVCDASAAWDVNSSVTFDGSCSTDPNGLPLDYAWDFDYDGNTFTTDSTQRVATNQAGYAFYTEDRNGNPLAGVVPPRACLRVTDALGASDTTCFSVELKPPPHPPVVVLAAPVFTTQPNTPVQLDASQSYDVDNDPITFAWDLNDDGAFTDATGAVATPSFAAAGTYVVGVQVTDHPELNANPYQCPPGTSCSTTVTRYVQVVVGSKPPVASAGGPYTSPAGTTITLDAENSFDPGGSALTYAWDLDGSGLFAGPTTRLAPFTVPPGTPAGTVYPVCVRVTNDTGGSGTACSTVNVVAEPVPPVCSILTPNVVMSNTGGPQTVVLDGSRSHDPNGAPLTFSWTTDGPGSFDDPAAAMPTQSFAGVVGADVEWNDTLTVSDGLLSSSCAAHVSLLANLPPVFTAAPHDLTVELGSNTTATVNAWLAGVTAAEPGAPSGTDVPVANDSNFPARFYAGFTARVTWTATNPFYASAESSASATLLVVDTTPPVLSLPSDILQEATEPGGAVVDYTATAHDAVDGDVPIACSPASGSTFPLGTTLVECTAQDSAGNVAGGKFEVTVADTTPPTLVAPADVTTEATGPSGAAVGYSAPVGHDLVDGDVAAACVPASGSTFPLGATTVGCTATDAHGNTAEVSFTVTVVDTTPPTLQLPSDMTVDATSPGGATVPFTATANDLVDGAVSVGCVPASGSTFGIGTTTVSCSATDGHANTATGTFSVVVRGAQAQLGDLLALTVGVGPGQSLQAKVRTALSEVQAGDVADACSTLDGFVAEVRAQAGKRSLTAAQAQDLAARAARIQAVLGC